ncbi:MAG TPA: 6-phosphogluconolactonase [Candidatus Ozemobacteraceae bacterium]|nr:6-phosphogluconolactonase [Candidatus Ozemobacteraceae bacterium]
MSPATIKVFPDPEFATSAALALAEHLCACPPGHSRWIGLSGGETPRPVYTALRNNLQANPLPWRTCTWFQVDERCVPPQQSTSNQRLIRDTLFPTSDQQPWGTFFSIQHPERIQPAADEYNSQLANLFSASAFTRHTSLILGVGADGHTASLFPDTDWRSAVRNEWYTAIQVPHLNAWRLSLTLHALMQADDLVFLVTGSAKQKILCAMCAPQPDLSLPAVYLATRHASVTMLIDRSAAGALQP